jgi:hypothetical protein
MDPVAAGCSFRVAQPWLLLKRFLSLLGSLGLEVAVFEEIELY